MSAPTLPNSSRHLWPVATPSDWQLGPLKRLIGRMESGVSVNALDQPSDPGIPGVLKTSCVYTGEFDPRENKTVVESERHLVACPVEPGALIVSRMNTPDLVGSAGLVRASAPDLYLPDRLWQIRFSGLNPRFAHYWTQSALYRLNVQVACSGTSASMQNLSQDDFRGFPIAVPPVDLQGRLADWLDRETARIDALVEKKTRFIEMLREKRQALITEVVTGGFQSLGLPRHSAVNWFGELPKHWEVAPAKYLCSLLKDGTHLPPIRVDSGVALLSVRNIVDGAFVRLDDDSQISQEDFRDLCRAFRPAAGDVLLAIVGATLGKCAVVPDDFGDFHVQRSLAVFRGRPDRVTSSWLKYTLRSTGFQSLLWENVGYSAQPGIYLGTLGDFPLPVPPMQEQHRLSEMLDEQTAKLDGLIRRTELSIRLLSERRSALITAAVTGQIDLRAEVPQDQPEPA